MAAVSNTCPDGAGRARAGTTGAIPAVLAALVVLVLLDVTGAGAQDVQVDPFAFTRVDPTAAEHPLLAVDRTTGTELQLKGRALLEGSGELYLDSADVATLLQGSRFWDGRLRYLELKCAGGAFGLTAGTRLVTGPQGETLLPVPVLYFDDELWLPMVALTDVLGPALGLKIDWDPDRDRLEMGAVQHNITGIRTEVLGRATVVHIECSEPLGYRASGTRDGNIEVKIYGGSPVPSLAARVRARGLLRGVGVRRVSGAALLILRADDLVGHFRTYTDQDGREIVVVLEEEQVSALPEPVPRGRVDVNIATGPVDVTHDLTVGVVVIDPGHGGHDMGAVGPDGIMEKNVNLAVARELRSYLEHQGDLKVILTRDRDEFIELDRRAELANTAGGNLFISLHCNSWFNDSASGLETYFLSPARSDWARSVAAAENGSGADGSLDVPDDVEFIVWELVQNRFISSSSHLAEVIQDEATADLGMENRGVRQAGFRVLVGAYMPAVLVEMGFLSNPREERKLGSAPYQHRLAQAIGDAILSYRDEMAELQGTTGGASHGR